MPRLVAAFVRVHLGPAMPGLVATGMLVFWAADDGGYDPSTWYWGALLALSMLTVVVGTRWGRPRLHRATALALACFAAYVVWSYVSTAWASSPGDALEGGNRALLYLLVFALFAVLPWTPLAGLTALTLYALGVGVLAVSLLWRLATGDQLGQLVIEGRLAAPTGYSIRASRCSRSSRCSRQRFPCAANCPHHYAGYWRRSLPGACSWH